MSDEEPQPEGESEEEESQDASDEDEWEETVHQPHEGEEGQREEPA